MAAVWNLGEASVDDVRGRLPRRRRSAYNTVQTVMNRLVERGLLERQRQGRVFVYSACYDEAAYVWRAVSERLDEASPDARRATLQKLVGGLSGSELAEVARFANRIERDRKDDG
jgi:BlaI family transcriptional regulator, penicillinase repressor